MFLSGVIRTLELWVKKAGECFKHYVMGHTSRSIENNTAECDLMNCGDQEISEEKHINTWPRDWSCDILVKNVAAFDPCPKILPKAKLKSLVLILLAEKISK